MIHLQRRAGQTCDPLYYDLFENTLKSIFELNNCLEVGIYKLHIWFSLKGLNNPSQAKYPYMIGIRPYHNILIMIWNFFYFLTLTLNIKWDAYYLMFLYHRHHLYHVREGVKYPPRVGPIYGPIYVSQHQNAWDIKIFITTNIKRPSGSTGQVPATTLEWGGRKTPIF